MRAGTPMKNTLLSALLALGIGLTPGFGFNFMSGSSVNFGHGDVTDNPSKTVEMTVPAPQSPAPSKLHVAHNQAAPKVPNKVASADTSTVK